MSIDLQQRKRAAITVLEYYLEGIRDKTTLFYGTEGPVVLAVPSEQLRYHPLHGLYFPKEEKICERVATVARSSSKPYIVTDSGVIACPVTVNGWRFWSRKRSSALYVAVSSEELRELDVKLLEEIRESLRAVVSDDTRC